MTSPNTLNVKNIRLFLFSLVGAFALALLARVVLVGWADWVYRPALSAIAKPQFGAITNNAEFTQEVERVNQAIDFDPLQSRYPALLGRMYYQRMLNLPKGRLSRVLFQRKALVQFEKAFELNPRDIRSLQHIVLLKGNLGQIDSAVGEQIELLAKLSPREFITHLPILRSYAPVLSQLPISLQTAYLELFDAAYRAGGPAVLGNLKALAKVNSACGYTSKSAAPGNVAQWPLGLCNRLKTL